MREEATTTPTETPTTTPTEEPTTAPTTEPSAPADGTAGGKAAALFEHYGLTTAHIGRAIDEVLAG